MSARKVLRLSNDRTRAKVVAELFERCRKTGRKFVVATTGGGGGLAKWILGMPGASACLVEYRVSLAIALHGSSNRVGTLLT